MQVFDDSFAKAPPLYEAPKRKKRNSKQEKKEKKQEKQRSARPMSTESGRGLILARPPSPGSSRAGTFGQGLKMKANPGMAMAMARIGPQEKISQGFTGQEVEVYIDELISLIIMMSSVIYL